LDRVRQDITSSRLLEYNLTEQVMKVVQDVSMRQTEQGMTVGTSKVFWYLGDSVSNGRTSLDPLDWEESKKMEKERKERAALLHARRGVNMARGMPMHLNAGQ